MTWQTGKVVRWNDAKGFGFIKPAAGGADLFFHVSAARGLRPQVGQYVEFLADRDDQGRACASQVRRIERATQANNAFKASRLPQWLMLALLIAAVVLWQVFSTSGTSKPIADGQYDAPLERTLQLIDQGGPYPYSQDNTVFQNRERLLPAKPRGYYREYTVETPGLSHRGPRRVVTGGQPPEVWYYTEDHYRSFIRLEPKP